MAEREEAPEKRPSWLTEKQEREISTLSANCSCMTEVVRDMLLTAVQDKIRLAYKDVRDWQEIAESARKSAKLHVEPKIAPITERYLAETMIELDSYMALKKELKNIKLCE